MPLAYANLHMNGVLVIDAMEQSADGGVLVAGNVRGSAEIDPNGSGALLVSNSNPQGGAASQKTGFVGKYDADGVLVWASRIGSTGANLSATIYSTAHEIKTDGGGNIYVGGFYQGDKVLQIGQPFDPDADSDVNLRRLFLSKFSPSGELLFEFLITGSTAVGFSTESPIDPSFNGMNTRRPFFDVDETGNIALVANILQVSGTNAPHVVTGPDFNWTYFTPINTGNYSIFMQMDASGTVQKKGIFNTTMIPTNIEVADGEAYISAQLIGATSSFYNLYFKHDGFVTFALQPSGFLTLPNQTFVSPDHHGSSDPILLMPFQSRESHAIIRSHPDETGFDLFRISNTQMSLGVSTFTRYYNQTLIRPDGIYFMGNINGAASTDPFEVSLNNVVYDNLELNIQGVPVDRSSFVIKLNRDMDVVLAKSYYDLSVPTVNFGQSATLINRLAHMDMVRGRLAVYGAHSFDSRLALATDSTALFSATFSQNRNPFIAFVDTATLGIREVWNFEEHGRFGFPQAMSAANNDLQFWVAIGYRDSLNIGGPGAPEIVEASPLGIQILNEAVVLVRYSSLPGIYLGADTVACEELLLDAGADYDTYLWSNGETTQSINITESGTYSVTGENAEGSGQSNAIQVVIENAPTAEFGYVYDDPSVFFAGTDGPTASYAWQFGDGTFGTGQFVTKAYFVEGEFQVTLLVGNTCGQAETSQTILAGPVSTINEHRADALLYPNPASDQVNLRMDAGHVLRTRVLDLQGRQIAHRAGNWQHWNLSNLAPGMYIFVLETDLGQQSFLLEKVK